MGLRHLLAHLILMWYGRMASYLFFLCRLSIAGFTGLRVLFCFVILMYYPPLSAAQGFWSPTLVG